MEELRLSKNQLEQAINFAHGTEAPLIYLPENENELIKLYNPKGKITIFAPNLTKIRRKSILVHDFYEQYPIEGLVVPKRLATVNGNFIGPTFEKKDASNFSFYLTNRAIDIQKKIVILKQIGEILKSIRNAPAKFNACFGDVHPDNFMVSGADGSFVPEAIKTFAVDTVSMGIGNIKCDRYYYKTSNLMPFSKYTNSTEKGKIPSANLQTDSMGYILMVLAVISREEETIHHIPIDRFNEYLDFLDTLGIDPNLLSSFRSIYEDKDNIDPLPYLEGLKNISPELKTSYSYFSHVHSPKY